MLIQSLPLPVLKRRTSLLFRNKDSRRSNLSHQRDLTVLFNEFNQYVGEFPDVELQMVCKAQALDPHCVFVWPA